MKQFKKYSKNWQNTSSLDSWILRTRIHIGSSAVSYPQFQDSHDLHCPIGGSFLCLRIRCGSIHFAVASPFVIPSFLHPNSILSQVDYANAASGGSPCSTSPGGGGGTDFNGGGISRIAAAAAAETSNAMFVQQQQQQHEQNSINSQQQQQVGDLPGLLIRIQAAKRCSRSGSPPSFSMAAWTSALS